MRTLDNHLDGGATDAPHPKGYRPDLPLDPQKDERNSYLDGYDEGYGDGERDGERRERRRHETLTTKWPA